MVFVLCVKHKVEILTKKQIELKESKKQERSVGAKLKNIKNKSEAYSSQASKVGLA